MKLPCGRIAQDYSRLLLRGRVEIGGEVISPSADTISAIVKTGHPTWTVGLKTTDPQVSSRSAPPNPLDLEWIPLGVMNLNQFCLRLKPQFSNFLKIHGP